MRHDEMNRGLSRSAGVETTPPQLRPIENALDGLADLERSNAPAGLEERIASATMPSVLVTRPTSQSAESEPPLVIFRFASLRVAAAIALLATVSVAWLAMQSGGLLPGGVNVEPDLDDWDLFASVSFPPLDYTSYDLFEDTDQFTVSLAADMIESEPLFEEGSM